MNPSRCAGSPSGVRTAKQGVPICLKCVCEVCEQEISSSGLFLPENRS